MSTYEVAHLNIAITKGAMDSPVMADFAANLERINALADSSPGFVWRLETEEGDATAIRLFEHENLLINMSVWRDIESLNEFVYNSDHVGFMRGRKQWFEPMREAFLVLWWVRKGHRPRIEEAGAKLELLRTKGPSSDAFTFRQTFAPPDTMPLPVAAH